MTAAPAVSPERHGMAARAASAATAAATAFVDAHLEAARALGRAAAEEVQDPASLVATLRAGYERLGDPVYRDAQAWVAPGSGPSLGVRAPLQRATWGAFRRRTRLVRPSSLLLAADALLRVDATELRLFAISLVERVLPDDPERAWQLLRRSSREAGDWVIVDSLARAAALGIIREPYRWAELEQLVYSPSRWERRLVGSTIATIPFVDRVAGRVPAIAERALGIVRELIGDADPEVRKALAWALRSLARVDPGAVEAFCRAEAAIATATADPHRARVIRDALSALPGPVAGELRAALAPVRARRGSPSTSRASAIAAAFAIDADPAGHPEPPLR